VISVLFLGRFGNNLFQYVMGRIVSQHTSDPTLVYPDLPLCPRTAAGALTRRASQLLSLPGVRKLAYRAANRLVGQGVNLAALRPGHVLLRGYFQRYEHYAPHLASIRGPWLQLPALERRPPDELTINLRGGNIWEGGCRRGRPVHPHYPALPLSFYARVVESRRWSEVQIVSEDRDDPMAEALVRRFGATRLPPTPVVETFVRLRASSNLVLPVSTFTWWAALLSGASRIYYPVAGIFSPKRMQAQSGEHCGVSLVVQDDPRYEYYELDDGAQWRGRPEDRARLLSS
jgi:hypothetical protein